MYRLSLQAQAVYGLRQAFSDASAFEQTEGLDACHLPKLAQNPSAQSREGKARSFPGSQAQARSSSKYETSAITPAAAAAAAPVIGPDNVLLLDPRNALLLQVRAH